MPVSETANIARPQARVPLVRNFHAPSWAAESLSADPQARGFVLLTEQGSRKGTAFGDTGREALQRANLMITRQEKFDTLDGTFDVLVIGGGATGLGVAVDAQTRGYRTALVEASDFAQATSSRATKLVHGGVRYLASGQVHLVYEALHERKVMITNAPHLVHPLPFLTPAQRWFDLPYYGAGLKFYDLLSGKSSLGSTQLLSRAESQNRIPGLAAGGLKGGILYFDGQFDDARLGLALARTAEDHGAAVLNYARCVEVLHHEGKASGAVIEDVETGQRRTILAKAVVNATGVFVDSIRTQDQADARKLLSVSRGTHIVVSAEVLGAETALMVPKTADGRVIFAIPWLGKVVIGTTDVPVDDVTMEPGYQESEIEFLLETINPFLARKLERADVLSVFSGLRPLVSGSAASTAKLSREHHIEASPSGMVTVAGGKWTTYRRMAEDTVDFAIRKGLLAKKPCISGNVKLRGATTELNGNRSLARYGSDAAEVRALAQQQPELAEVLDAALPFTRAEVVYAVRKEMARTVEDVLSRRTRALLLDARAAERAAPTVAALMAGELGQDEAWQVQQTAQFRTLARQFYELR